MVQSSTARAALEGSRFVEAYEGFRLLIDDGDSSRGSLEGFAWCCDRLGRFDLALDAWSDVLELDTADETAQWRMLHCAAELGRPGADDALLAAAVSRPGSVGLLLSAGGLLRTSRDERLHTVMSALAAHPNLAPRADAVGMLDAAGDVEAAEDLRQAVLREHDDLGDDSPLTLHQYAKLIVRHDLVAFETALADLVTEFRSGPTAQVAQSLRRWMLRPSRFEEYRELVDGLPSMLHDPQTEAAIVEVLISVGSEKPACERIEALVDTVAAGSVAVERARAWWQARIGLIDDARETRKSICWPHTRHLRRALSRQEVVPSHGPPTGATVVCVTSVRDERHRIERFCDHHRDLGVERFWVVDDDSIDGTGAWLAAQADVDALAATSPFWESGSGSAWTASLARSMPADSWIFTADADELLVLPPDTPDVTSFISSLAPEVVGVHANVIDLFLGPDGEWWFDTDFVAVGRMGCPPLGLVGGVRYRVLDDDTSPELVKTPFARADSWCGLWDTHEVLPVRLAPRSVALLHTKLCDGPIPRRQHHNDRRQQSTLSRSGQVVPGPRSVRYQGPEQLAALGLIGSPPPAGTFVDARGVVPERT